MRNLVTQPSNPTPSNPHDYYIICLPGRTIYVLRLPFWVPSGKLSGLAYQDLKAQLSDPEEIFALSVVKHIRDGTPSIAAASAALYEVREWADSCL